MKEIMKVVVRLVWLYEMRIAEGLTLGEGAEHLGEGRRRKGALQMRSLFVAKADGPMVRFRAHQRDC